jgi:glutamate-1-semialdehyde 2,1-aminomutase
MVAPITFPSSRLGLIEGSETSESKHWFDRAQRVLAGGISSSARATTTGSLPYPLYITHGQGAHIWDADGNEYLDYLCSYGSCILGHANPALTDAVASQLDLGTMFGTCNTVEVELAEQICRMVPCADRVRFANSGSEAILGAIRAARGFTGKSKILKFEGHYHGWIDTLAVSNRPSAEDSGPMNSPFSCPHSMGMTLGVVQDVIICPWNNAQILRAILDEHDGEFAAVIAEPIVANNACIMPSDGYLETLREECTNRGIVLIFDEIVTGFRVARGGAQELFDVIPDMAVYSKAIGGGFPLSAFGGRKAIMDLVASNNVKHGGTYNGNPLCASGALQTLRILSHPGVLQHMRDSGEQIMDAIRRSARRHGISCVVQGAGSMFQVIFNSDGVAPQHYRDLSRADSKRYSAFRQALLENGVLCNSSGLACWFVSAAHTPADTRLAISAVENAMEAIS